MFDHGLYDQVRTKYSAVGAFPELYDKVKPVRLCETNFVSTYWKSNSLEFQEAWLLEDRHEDDLL